MGSYLSISSSSGSPGLSENPSLRIMENSEVQPISDNNEGSNKYSDNNEVMLEANGVATNILRGDPLKENASNELSNFYEGKLENVANNTILYRMKQEISGEKEQTMEYVNDAIKRESLSRLDGWTHVSGTALYLWKPENINGIFHGYVFKFYKERYVIFTCLKNVGTKIYRKKVEAEASFFKRFLQERTHEANLFFDPNIHSTHVSNVCAEMVSERTGVEFSGDEDLKPSYDTMCAGQIEDVNGDFEDCLSNGKQVVVFKRGDEMETLLKNSWINFSNIECLNINSEKPKFILSGNEQFEKFVKKNLRDYEDRFQLAKHLKAHEFLLGELKNAQISVFKLTDFEVDTYLEIDPKSNRAFCENIDYFDHGYLYVFEGDNYYLYESKYRQRMLPVNAVLIGNFLKQVVENVVSNGEWHKPVINGNLLDFEGHLPLTDVLSLVSSSDPIVSQMKRDVAN